MARVRGRDRGLDPGRVDEVRVGLDVDEDRRRAGEQDRADGRVEGVRDGDDLVARLEAQAGEDAHLGDRAVRDGDGVLDADELGPARLELGDLAALDDHAAGEDLGDGGRLFGTQVRASDRDHAGAPCLTVLRAVPVCSTSASGSGT